MNPTPPPVRITGTCFLNVTDHGAGLRFRPSCGSRIQDVVRESIALAKSHDMDCEFTFNDISITVDKNSDYADVLLYYKIQMGKMGVDVRIPELCLTGNLGLLNADPVFPRPRIIQILMTPNDATWQGRLLGLGDDGVTYHEYRGAWEPFVPALTHSANTPPSTPDASHPPHDPVSGSPEPPSTE